ncbi:hypothetical protein DFP72DRAFT_855369 [Ephemerocybe angulata]|uniref:Uncharacterized protein n=1 Tax=Ephemerocybe angulata TaxID=980116 RepID=A0A8H6LZQ9_9AGAR|nr:hypothetical protein DFP72DRAFT_855369 [Tulosesus angulatus]
MYTHREGGVSRGHDVAHAALNCDCLADEDLEWETMSELGYLRFGYRLYVAYKDSARFEKRIRRGYAAGWAELFGESDSSGAGAPPPPPMFDAEDRPLDFSCHPEMEKVYPVPWPVPRIQDLEDENAPPPTPLEILARVPAPLGPVVASEEDRDDMDVTETGPAVPATFHAPPPPSSSVTRESSLSTLPRSPSPDTTPEVTHSTSFATYRSVSAAVVDSPAPPLTTPAIFYAPPLVSQPTPTIFYAPPPAAFPLPQSQFTMRYTPPPPPLPPPPPPPQQPSTVTFAASVSTTATATATTPVTRIPPIVDHLLSEIDEVGEALEAEREMRRLGDVEVRKLRDEIAELRRMIKERVGR